MKKETILFVHDGPRWKNVSNEQFGSAADLELFEKYRYLATDVSLAMRVFQTDSFEGLVNLSKRNLMIYEIKAFNRPAIIHHYFSSKKHLEEVIKQHDIIIARLPSTIGSLAVKISKKLKKSCFIEVVACPFDSLYHHSILGKLYAPFAFYKMKRLVKNAPFVMYVTNHFLQNKYPSKGKSIGCSDVILKSIPKTNPKGALYEHFNKSKTIQISTTGKVDLSTKGFQHVLKVIPKLKNLGYSVVYNIIGGGDQEKLRSISKELDISEKVIFHGKLNHESVFKLLQITDLYIQPSQTEGLPRALVEAMSYGCACLGSNVGGIPELLDPKCLFQTNNTLELLDKIVWILQQEQLTLHSERNFSVSQHYSYHALQNKRNQFYDLFLNSINEK
jgi:glycosyltransferase involved in cell wall biosynthesis